MSDRLVRDLLDANLELTRQLVELARLCIGAPSVVVREESTNGVSEPDFSLSTSDDWEDIPDQPLGKPDPDPVGNVRMLEIPRRDAQASALPLHVPEEEEDMRFEVGMGLRPAKDLTDLLQRYDLPGQDIELQP